MATAAYVTDEDLAARSADGAKDAFAELYERYYGSIYDFAVRILRDRETAADVVQATFTRAWPALRDGTRPTHVKAWLFGIARNLAIDELRRRRRLFPTEGIGLGLAELPDPAAYDPAETVETKELAELVWTSAAGLRAEEYALLDLHVRRGLTADELADSLGVRRGAVYTRLTRLRKALETAVATSLLIRHGRGRCAELDRLVADQRAQGTLHEGRRVVQSHVEDCPRCQESKGAYASPAQILAGLALVPPPEELAHGVWAVLGTGVAGVGALAATGKAGGGLGGIASQVPAPVGIAAGGFATVATVVALGIWAVGGGDDDASKAVTPAASPAAAEAASTPSAPQKSVRRTNSKAAKERAGSDRVARGRPDRTGEAGVAYALRADGPSAPAGVDAPPAGAPPAAPPPTSTPSPPRDAPSPPRDAPSPSPQPSPPAKPPPPRAPPARPPPPGAPPAPVPPPAAPPAPAPPPPAPPAEERKVTVCLNGNTLVVASSAIPGLLRAGATLGACANE